MIPDYKLYHGAVLADIVDASNDEISVRAIRNSGRLLNYVINEVVGLQVKYATQRLRPWCFTFPVSHVQALEALRCDFRASFLVLVCRTDGIIAAQADDIIPLLKSVGAEQSWLRVDRKKREMYRLYSQNGEFPAKFRTTVEPIVDALHQSNRSNT